MHGKRRRRFVARTDLEVGMADDPIQTDNSSAKSPPQYPVGTAVRVKKGTKDPDFPDMPLGGWAGVVKEVEQDDKGALFQVEWNAYTLANIHPVHRHRCLRDGLELKSSWLGAEDLEKDEGGTPELEQPTIISPRPLDNDDQDDRIRAVFSLTSDEPLPTADIAALRTYRQYLAQHLSLPIAVDYIDQSTLLPSNTVPLNLTELPEPVEGTDGLLAVARQGDQRMEVPLRELEARTDGPARQLLGDYGYWLLEHGVKQKGPGSSSAIADGRWEEEPDEEQPESVRRTVLNAISRCGLYGAALGAAAGAVTATMQGVLFAMGVGACSMALVGYAAGTRYGFFFGKVTRINTGPIYGGILGLVGGAILGVVAGPLVIAYAGTLIGSIIGVILGQFLSMISNRLPGRFACGVFAALLGAIVDAWYADPQRVIPGLIVGIIVGAAAGLLLAAGFFGILVLIEMKRE